MKRRLYLYIIWMCRCIHISATQPQNAALSSLSFDDYVVRANIEQTANVIHTKQITMAIYYIYLKSLAVYI